MGFRLYLSCIVELTRVNEIPLSSLVVCRELFSNKHQVQNRQERVTSVIRFSPFHIQVIDQMREISRDHSREASSLRQDLLEAIKVKH